MKLTVRIGDREVALDLARAGSEWRFRFDSGSECTAGVEQPEPGVYSVLTGGRSYEAYVESGANGALVVTIDGRRFDIEVRDPRQFRPGRGVRGMAGVARLTAPMPGKLVRLLAAPGEQVAAGQPILVIEAMKMQNELRAPKSGRLAAISVREGETVAAGAVLVTIE
jgi:biotin carboxyl carrier protein